MLIRFLIFIYCQAEDFNSDDEYYLNPEYFSDDMLFTPRQMSFMRADSRSIREMLLGLVKYRLSPPKLAIFTNYTASFLKI